MTGRALKGSLGSTAVTIACFWLWTSLRGWAAHARGANADAFFAGFIESLTASIIGVASMPVLIWAGLRALGERGTYVVAAGSALSWFVIGSRVVEDRPGVTVTVALLALQASLTGALSGFARRRPRTRTP